MLKRQGRRIFPPRLAEPKEKQELLPVTALSFQHVFIDKRSALKLEGRASRALSVVARREKSQLTLLLRYKLKVSGNSANICIFFLYFLRH